MVLLLAVAIGGSLLMGFTGLTGASGVSALAAAGASPLPPAIEDCAAADAVHSREQNNAGNRILMGKGTTFQFCGAGALRLSLVLPGNFLVRQNLTRLIAHGRRVLRECGEAVSAAPQRITILMSLIRFSPLLLAFFRMSNGPRREDLSEKSCPLRVGRADQSDRAGST